MADRDPNLLVEKVLASIRKAYGEEAAGRLSDEPAEVECIPTGIDVVDRYVIGCGGLPVGRLTEVYSEEGVGKTSMGLSCAAGAFRAGGVVGWAETEGTLMGSRAQVFGVDIEQLVLMQPGSIEEAGKLAEAFIRALPASAGPSLFVWDSIAATPTEAEFDGGLADPGERMGQRAVALGRICKLLIPQAREKRCAILFINQVREKIGVMFGDKFTTPGGHAVKFHASVRLQLFTGKADKDETGEHQGKNVTFLAAKNKLAPPWRKAQVRLSYADGWDNRWTSIWHAKDRKVVADSARVTDKTYQEAIEKLGWPR